MNFLDAKFASLAPYTPGEQPNLKEVIKLNTNENPFPPAPGVITAVSKAAQNLQLYSDPTCHTVIEKLADLFDVSPEEVFVGNGSDEILSFCFQGLMEHGVIYPQISYGFYPVYAQLHQVVAQEVPLAADLTIDLTSYQESDKTVIIANPNAPTGIALSRERLTQLVESNPERLVIIDEAYVDFGAESMVPLIQAFDNLLVVGTFSKSRQLAGARLGYAIGNPSLIQALNQLKFSLNPYNVNSMTLAAGRAALEDQVYFEKCQKAVIETRAFTKQALVDLGFAVTDSQANFLFAKHEKIAGNELFTKLRDRNIFVRWFDKDSIRDYLRISIGTKEQMVTFIEQVTQILKENGVA
ncbi:MAG: histidinol-phosphate transaminase [Enterococcus sp.]